MRRSVRSSLSLLLLVVVSGCATTPGGQRLAERDPLENFNRSVWDFNMAADRYALKPAASVYTTVTPTAARRGVRNVLNNADEPISFFNALLQGKVGKALHTLGRFVVNTTIGVGGLADHATSMGLEERPEDFGQTLAVWGVNAGPYIVLPLFGPSTLRDLVGFGTEQFADPSRIALRKYSGLSRTERYGITALEAVNLRVTIMGAGADTMLNTSLDPYATARTAFLQLRHSQILDLDDSSSIKDHIPDINDFDIETDESESASAPLPPGVSADDFEIINEPPITAETDSNSVVIEQN